MVLNITFGTAKRCFWSEAGCLISSKGHSATILCEPCHIFENELLSDARSESGFILNKRTAWC